MERSPRMGVSFTRSLNVLSPIQVKGAQYTAATATNTAKKRTGEVKSVERAAQGRRSMAAFSAYPASADPGLSPINKLSTIKVSPFKGAPATSPLPGPNDSVLEVRAEDAPSAEPRALVAFLRNEVDRAWASEEALKNYVREMAAREEEGLARAAERLKTKEGFLRSELERWLMRAEELETRLIDSQQRCCDLKGVALIAQRQYACL